MSHTFLQIQELLQPASDRLDSVFRALTAIEDMGGRTPGLRVAIEENQSAYCKLLRIRDYARHVIDNAS